MSFSTPVRRAIPIPFLITALCISFAGSPAGSAQDMSQSMDRHMKLTTLRPLQLGDQQRADSIVVAAHKSMDRFADYRKALASGYTIFLPGMRQSVYHFTRTTELRNNIDHFDPDKPTSLLYVKVPDPAVRYKIIGVMYTAPNDASEEELNRRVPLSIARWHQHRNICLPPVGEAANLDGSGKKFGPNGSIVTAEECQAGGGRFIPRYLAWMVHVYAYETNPARIWVSGMDDEHAMHDPIGPGMQ